jgi:uncharacterized protein (DUF1330 family)
MANDELARFYGFGRDGTGALPAVLDPPPAGPVVLVNLFALRPEADYGEATGDEPCSGVEAMLRYAAVSGDRLAAVGGRFLHQGLWQGTLWGEDGPWDLVVVAEYPTGQAILDLLADPAYRAAYRHRRAAVARQRVVASVPIG